MAKRKYVVIAGKHGKEDGTSARQGEVIELDEEVAAKFQNKFRLFEEPAPPVKEEPKEPKTPPAAAANSSAPAPVTPASGKK